MIEAQCLTKTSGEKPVPAHLTLLRDALACGQGQSMRAGVATRAERSHACSRRSGSDRAAPTMQITLAQWVSRTTSSIK
ncbi:hypothetical protein ACFV8T_28245 [Streptomyces sp. NPDC059832]|uniref:hypothetical protein n=1 Tax=unclassified Streptomyces TaxID=2593676 RepID=UPI0036529FCC